jgi:serine/threonine-protein kinase
MHPSGTSAARGATVAIVPSAGPRPIVIPPVAGSSQEAAVAALERLGLAVTAYTAYEPAPSGTAVATMPPVGTSVPPHSSVALTISAGPAPLTPAEPASPPGKATGPANDKAHGNGHEGKPQKQG